MSIAGTGGPVGAVYVEGAQAAAGVMYRGSAPQISGSAQARLAAVCAGRGKRPRGPQDCRWCRRSARGTGNCISPAFAVRVEYA